MKLPLFIIIITLTSVLFASSNISSTFDRATREDADTIVMNYTRDGREHREAKYWINNNGFVYVDEYDPDILVKIRTINRRSVSLYIEQNLEGTSEIQLKRKEDIQLCTDKPGTYITTLSPEPRTLAFAGEECYNFELTYNRWFNLEFTEDDAAYHWFIGGGAGGGGGLGCTPGCSISSITADGGTPGSTNTETTFEHDPQVTGSFPGGCECVLSFFHQPSSQYVGYTSSYPSSFSKPVAKLISGSQAKVITTGGGNHENDIQCGGQQGTLNLRVTGDGETWDKSVTCNDVVDPTIVMNLPANESDFEQPLINLSCNVTDNTGLATTRFWDNRSGNWVNTHNYSHPDLDYSRTVTANMDYTGYESTKIDWNCTVVDTAPNYADDGVRWFNYTQAGLCGCKDGVDCTLSTFCHLADYWQICPGVLNITNGGYLNISNTGVLNASWFLDNNVDETLRLNVGGQIAVCQ